LYVSGDSKVSSRAQGKKMRVGINLAFHGIVDAQQVLHDLPKITMLLKTLKFGFDAELHYISHAPDDRILRHLFAARGIFMRWHDLPLEALPGIYKSLDFHICQMMHSAIFAMGAGVPTISIAYDEKAFALFKLLNMDSYCVPISSWEPDDLLLRFGTMMAHKSDIRQHLEVRVAELDGISREFLVSACDQLRRLPSHS
jgi:hypothetical protein